MSLEDNNWNREELISDTVNSSSLIKPCVIKKSQIVISRKDVYVLKGVYDRNQREEDSGSLR